MENRSFDHYFGSATFREDLVVDGLMGDESNLRADGTPVPVFQMANLQPEDPPHGWDSCHLQWNLGLNDGFVTEHELVHPAFYGVAGFFGLGLMFAGATGTCGLALLIAELPWNQE